MTLPPFTPSDNLNNALATAGFDQNILREMREATRADLKSAKRRHFQNKFSSKRERDEESLCSLPAMDFSDAQGDGSSTSGIKIPTLIRGYGSMKSVGSMGLVDSITSYRSTCNGNQRQRLC